MTAFDRLKGCYETWKEDRKERLRQNCLQYMVYGNKPLLPRQEHIGLLHSREYKR